MQQKYFVIVTLVLFSFQTTGQIKLGGFLGMNRAKLSGDAPEQVRYRSVSGLNAGVLLEYQFSNTVTLSLQPSFSQEGTKVSYKLPGRQKPIDSIQIGLNYLSFPLMVKISASNPRFYAISGVETGILLNSYQETKAGEKDVDVTLNEVNIAIHFGAGYRISIGRPKLYFELRYAQGFANITNEPLSKDIVPRVKTSGVKLFFGIEVPLSNSKK